MKTKKYYFLTMILTLAFAIACGGGGGSDDDGDSEGGGGEETTSLTNAEKEAVRSALTAGTIDALNFSSTGNPTLSIQTPCEQGGQIIIDGSTVTLDNCISGETASNGTITFSVYNVSMNFSVTNINNNDTTVLNGVVTTSTNENAFVVTYNDFMVVYNGTSMTLNGTVSLLLDNGTLTGVMEVSINNKNVVCNFNDFEGTEGEVDEACGL